MRKKKVMNEMEKTAIADETTTLTIDEKAVLIESMLMSDLKASITASGSEKVVSGTPKKT